MPKAPAGGGFSSELYTLNFLYQEWQYRNNIWTHSNDYMDLCRYTGCKFTFFSDPKTDFIIVYDIVPPFSLEKHTYMNYHPQQLLLRKHKKILLSKRNNPKGKHKLTLKIRPPKQMSTKWFFQHFFSDAGLVNITCAAASFDYPELSCCNENQIISIYYLDPTFFYSSDWAATKTGPYMPITTAHGTYTFKYNINNKEETFKIPTTGSTSSGYTYNDSISYDKGWFNKGVLNAFEVTKDNVKQANLPCGVARYNVALDHGKGNKIWLAPITNGHYNVPRDEDLIVENIPLWLAFYGYTSYLWQKKHDASYFKAYMIVLQSQAIKTLQTVTPPTYYPIIDRNFQLGKAPGQTYLDNNMKTRWYPTLNSQLETINNFVLTGPYIPKYGDDKDSTWQLKSRYSFYFKWGGPQQHDQTVADPAKQPQWNVPDHLQQGVQVSDPTKQKWETIFHPWDYRRGKLTEKALKRMYDNLSTDESLLSDADYQSPKKKARKPPVLKVPEQENKEIQSCLHSLFEKSTSQESQVQEEKNILQLIQQQKHQQQQLKLNLFTLIKDLKEQQKALLYHTGMLN